ARPVDESSDDTDADHKRMATPLVVGNPAGGGVGGRLVLFARADAGERTVAGGVRMAGSVPGAIRVMGASDVRGVVRGGVRRDGAGRISDAGRGGSFRDLA